jgi:NitT/TauT family transport system substrate-binding protein
VLHAAGLSLSDVDLQPLGFPTMMAALLNGSVDAGWEIEPFLSQAVGNGSVAVFKHGEEFVPGAQLGILALSSQFALNPDSAARFLAGWLKGARLYNDAYGKKDPRAREEVFLILKKRIPNMTDELLERVAPSGLDPDGKINVASLEDQQAFFVSSGSQEQAVDIKVLADAKFSEAAVKLLGGPYQ